MILDTSKLMEDLRAVIASATTEQLDVLVSLKEIMQERINELNEENVNDGSNAVEVGQAEESTSQEG